MGELDRHFGTDATLDSESRRQISDYLQRNGASDVPPSNKAELPRITNMDWFIRKHHGAKRLLKKGQIISLSDCGRCHRAAD